MHETHLQHESSLPYAPLLFIKVSNHSRILLPLKAIYFMVKSVMTLFIGTRGYMKIKDVIMGMEHAFQLYKSEMFKEKHALLYRCACSLFNDSIFLLSVRSSA